MRKPRTARRDAPPGPAGPAIAFHRRARVAGLSSAADSNEAAADSKSATRPLAPPTATSLVPTAHIAVGPSSGASAFATSCDDTSADVNAASAASRAEAPARVSARRRGGGERRHGDATRDAGDVDDDDDGGDVGVSGSL